MGNLSELTMKLLFLFLPGIIYYRVLHKLTFRPKKDFNWFLIDAFIFGIITYGAYGIVLRILGRHSEINFLNNIFISSTSLNYQEIFNVSICAAAFAFLYSQIRNQRLFENISKKNLDNIWMKINMPTFFNLCNNAHEFVCKYLLPKKFDRIDVWSEILDTPDSSYHWVRIIDYQIGQKYDGWVNKFSDNVKENELFLRDVIVFNMKNKELYRTPAMYITRQSENITIEFPIVKRGKNYDRYKIKKGDENDGQREKSAAGSAK